MRAFEPQPLRGAALLLSHCSPVVDDRPSAYTRLEEQIGGPLAHLLVRALVDVPQGRRGSSSP